MTNVILPEILAAAYDELGQDQEGTNIEKFFVAQYEVVVMEAKIRENLSEM